MCTAATYRTRDHYFGRTLDYEFSYAEEVTITPRNFPFRFRHLPELTHHYALIGMATVADNYPLYYEATNEAGLSMAGLNFPGNAVYHPLKQDADNVCSFELIPWLLGQCANIGDVRKKLAKLNVADTPFSAQFPTSPLHWMISDRDESIVMESMADGLHIYDNPVGVMTNNPPFDFQLFNLNNYLHLSTEPAENRFAPELPLNAYSRGMGMMGMPGDLSSASRFVRCAFVKQHSLSGESESESVSQFFHILGSVAQPRGCVHMGKGQYEITIYTSCCNTDKGIYYYNTYENSQITGVDMHHENLNADKLVRYPLVTGQQIKMQN